MPFKNPEARRAYQREYQRNWRQQGGEVLLRVQLAYGRRAYRKDPQRYIDAAWRYRLRRNFGLSPQQYDALLDAQQGLCAICDKLSKRRLAVDHDHATGVVRGLLCSGCNRGLGLMQDDATRLRAAATYLENWRNV